MSAPAAPTPPDRAPHPQTVALVVLAQEIDALLGPSPAIPAPAPAAPNDAPLQPPRLPPL